MVRWILHKVWEKINVVNTYREIKALGKKYGRRFFVAALVWEFIEDVVFPFISWKMGVPELIPVFIIFHFEPIVYPAFFWAFRTWDRIQGKEPWDPDRSAHSHHWRSAVKVLVFQLVVTGWLSHIVGWKVLAAFAILTGLFGFVYERIWNDSNYGIKSDDTVDYKRVLAKTGTYLLMTSFTLFPLLRITKVDSLIETLLLAQGITGVLYLVLETVWSKSVWGVHFVRQDTKSNKS